MQAKGSMSMENGTTGERVQIAWLSSVHALVLRRQKLVCWMQPWTHLKG